jgi:hypothetical protein
MSPEARYNSLDSWELGKRSWIKSNIEYPFLGNEIPEDAENPHVEIAKITLKKRQIKTVTFPEPADCYTASLVKATLKAAVSGDTTIVVTHLDIEPNGSAQRKTEVIAIIKGGEKEAQELSFMFSDLETAAFSVNGLGVVTLTIEFLYNNEDDNEGEEEEEDGEEEG